MLRRTSIHGVEDMEGPDSLFNIFTSTDYKVRFLKAKASATCLACGKPAVRFSTTSARFEYHISALCQECQCRFLGTNAPRPMRCTSGNAKLPEKGTSKTKTQNRIEKL